MSYRTGAAMLGLVQLVRVVSSAMRSRREKPGSQGSPFDQYESATL